MNAITTIRGPCTVESLISFYVCDEEIGEPFSFDPPVELCDGFFQVDYPTKAEGVIVARISSMFPDYKILGESRPMTIPPGAMW